MTPEQVTAYRSTQRFVVEGTWSGYRSGQRRVVHRQVVPRYKAAQLCKVTGFRFTDATTLDLSVRLAAPREKVVPILGYPDMIDKAWYKKLEGFIAIPF